MGKSSRATMGKSRRATMGKSRRPPWVTVGEAREGGALGSARYRQTAVQESGHTNVDEAQRQAS